MYKLIFGLVLALALHVIFASSAHAATINVADGNDETTVNSNCSLSEAITNVNNGDATAYPECAGMGVFGVDDTVNLPVGTITLIAHLPNITQSITIQGAGMDQTTINGDGQWKVFQNAAGVELDITVNQLRITAFDGVAIIANDSNLSISQLDIDGTNTTTTVQVQGGVAFLNNVSGGAKNLVAEDVYIHDFSGSVASNLIAGIAGVADSQGTINANLQRITVDNLSNIEADTQLYGVTFITGVTGGFGPATVNATLENITISGLNNTSEIGAAGVSIVGGLNAGSATVDITLDINNSTITDITGAESTFIPGLFGSGLSVSTAAMQPTDTVNVDVNVSNVIFINRSNMPSGNCGIGSFSNVFDGSGTENVNVSSQGGNLTDDTTCSSYFTQPADQNNVGNLASTLGTLSDNGGYVPTIPLLQGSPAIDAGVTVAGLTEDARGVSRPQGLAYDSGAYESPFTRTSENSGQGATPNQLAETGQSSLLIVLAAVSLLAIGTFTALRFTKQ